MEKYEKYKDSGVEWIGEVPESWNVLRLKYLVNSPLKYGANEVAEEENLENPRYIRITDFGNDGNLKSDTFKSLPPEVAAPFLLSEGDLLFARSGATVGKTFQFKNYSGKACFAGYLIKASFDPKIANSTYINYCTKGNHYENWKQSIFQQATIQNIGADKYNQFIIALPKTETEQTAIANYLDKKTSELDTLITKKEKLIELLEEERTAIINQAVTKGLDPDVEMKESGVDGGDHRWLGEIPARWEVKKLKYLLKDIRGGGTPSTDNPEYWIGNIPWVSPKDMKVPLIETTEDYVSEKAIIESSTQLIESNQLLLVVRSGILKHTLPLAINLVPVTLNQDMKALYTNELISVSYLYWLFYGLAGLVLNWCKKNGATVDSLDMEAFLNFSLAIPPLEEQNKIINYIVAEKDRVDTFTSKIEQEITLLKEYKTALISEVVTGKVKVV